MNFENKHDINSPPYGLTQILRLFLNVKPALPLADQGHCDKTLISGFKWPFMLCGYLLALSSHCVNAAAVRWFMKTTSMHVRSCQNMTRFLSVVLNAILYPRFLAHWMNLSHLLSYVVRNRHCLCLRKLTKMMMAKMVSIFLKKKGKEGKCWSCGKRKVMMTRNDVFWNRLTNNLWLTSWK